MKGEAMAMYDNTKLEWCNNYTTLLRQLELKKYDEVTAKILEYMDQYLKLSPEEQKAMESGKPKAGQKGDPTKKQRMELSETRPDIMFGIFVYYSGTGLTFDGIWFPPKQNGGMYSTRVPNKQSTQ